MICSPLVSLPSVVQFPQLAPKFSTLLFSMACAHFLATTNLSEGSQTSAYIRERISAVLSSASEHFLAPSNLSEGSQTGAYIRERISAVLSSASEHFTQTASLKIAITPFLSTRCAHFTNQWGVVLVFLIKTPPISLRFSPKNLIFQSNSEDSHDYFQL